MSQGKRCIYPPDFSYYSAYSTRNRVTVSFPEVSPYTKQSFKDECDINLIMRRYLETGQLPDIAESAPQYLDVSAAGDFRQAMEFVAGAHSLFHELPSGIRAQFENDPAQFVDFCSQEKNRPELEQMGLMKPRAEWVKTELENLKSSATPEPAPPAQVKTD